MKGYNFKIRLKDGQKFLGNRKKTTEIIMPIIDQILNGDILIPPPIPPQEKQVEVLCLYITNDIANKLSIIADENKTTIVELLRLGLEQNNLVSSR